MSVKRVVIHAGLPKTASTFLQVNVFPFISRQECEFNPPSLVDPLLELCKEVVTCGSTTPERIRSLRDRIDHELERIQAPTLLLSVEGFLPLHCGGYGRSDAILGVLTQLFDDPVMVVFLREQSAWIRSAYSFCLVSKFILPFDEYVNREGDGRFGDRVPHMLSVGVFDFPCSEIRDLVLRHFDTCYCFSFEDLFNEQPRVLKRLAKILGVPSLTVQSGDKVNRALDEGFMVTLSRRLARFPRHRWCKVYLFTRYADLGWIQKLDFLYLRYTGLLAMFFSRTFFPPSRKKANGRLFSERDIKCIQDFYRESNMEFWKAEDDRWLEKNL